MQKKAVTIVTGIIVLIAIIALIVFTITESKPPYQLDSFTKNYGLDAKNQVYCMQNATGTISEYNQDKSIIPASISKLYTFDFALTKLGKDFRYTTDIFLDGDTLYINGGGDPHFVIENLRSILKKVSNDNSVIISHFVFSPNFYFDWLRNPNDINNELVVRLKESAGAIISKNFTVAYSEIPYSGNGIKYKYQSAPLSILIKQINDYSTNISADVLFERLGGSSAFTNYMKQTYGTGKDKVYFGTGSGLENNYTTCELTLRVIKHLEKTANNLDLGIQNVMSIPRVDPGPLQKTLLSMATTSGIVAKSGYLDYHHNYAGIAYTTNGPIYFAVFGVYKDLADDKKTKLFVNNFVGNLLGAYVQIPFKYSHHNNADVPQNARILRITP